MDPATEPQGIFESIKKLFTDKPKGPDPVIDEAPKVPKPKRTPSVSATMIEGYLERCGYAYYLRHVLKQIAPPPTAFLKGGAVHAGAEENFKQKIKSFKDLESSKVQEAAAAAFDTRFKAEGITLTEEEESVGLSKVLGREKDRTVVLAGLYTSQVAPRHQPVIVEEFQRIQLREGLDLVVKLDLINDQQKIVDLKTSKRSMTQEQVDKSFQFTLYNLAYRAINKKQAAGTVVENLVDCPKNPKNLVFETSRTEAHFKKAIEKINLFLSGVEGEVFMPAQKGSWWCSEGSCGYARSCKYFQFYKRGGGKAPVPFWMNRKKNEK